MDPLRSLCFAALLLFATAQYRIGPWHVIITGLNCMPSTDKDMHYDLRLSRVSREETVLEGSFTFNRTFGPVGAIVRPQRKSLSGWITDYVPIGIPNTCTRKVPYNFLWPWLEALVPPVREDCFFEPGVYKSYNWSYEACLRVVMPPNLPVGVYKHEVAWTEGGKVFMQVDILFDLKDKMLMEHQLAMKKLYKLKMGRNDTALPPF